MTVRITDDAEADIETGFWFYESQSLGLGEYFRSSILTDIDSLAFFGGVHPKVRDWHCVQAKRFPIAIYYECDGTSVTVVAVLDARRNPSWIERKLD